MSNRLKYYIIITFILFTLVLILEVLDYSSNSYFHTQITHLRNLSEVFIVLFMYFLILEYKKNSVSFNNLLKKDSYLEHSAKILRHDMHSGINTYIPRGIKSIEKRLSPENISKFKLESSLRMLKEGLHHTQKVYNGVYEFTNLVKDKGVLSKSNFDLKKSLDCYLSTTSYKSKVKIDNLITLDINESLFCIAIDNLIRNGLKYNDSEDKLVHIYMDNDELVIQDNGRGLTQKEFNHLSKPYVRKENQKESGSGLGLNICVEILKEHGFSLSCNKNEIGTKIKIKLK